MITDFGNCFWVPLFGGNYKRAGGGLQKRKNILKSGPVTVNLRVVIQIQAGNSDSGW